MAIVGVGDSLVLMQGFARQKAIAVDPRKRARRIHFRRYVVPSETKQSLPARLCLARAAAAAYGKSFEEVVASVQVSCSGKDYGGKAKADAIRTAKHAATAANIRRMEAKLAAL